jgi:acetyl-CoA acetyltransferase family protein
MSGSKPSLEVLILDGARTPFCVWSSGTNGRGEKGGALRPFDPFDLGAWALKGALKRAGLEASRLDKVIFGNMYQVGLQACYGARYVAHRAGAPPEIPCLTVNFACGTGLQALIASAEDISLGNSRIVGVGGTDNVSLLRREIFISSFTDTSCGLPIGRTAQDMAWDFRISREDQDAWALRSHERALRAQRAERFKEEIVPLGEIKADDHILENPEARFFALAKPLFAEGSVTGANTHGIVDGASAMILASESVGREIRGEPLGRYLGGCLVGLDPRRMAYASVPAVEKLLKSLKLRISDIDLFEINETFAAQVLIDIRELGLPEDRVNVNGGALALGHPFAGTGCRLVLTLLKELKNRSLRRAVASICVGGGQGVAVAVEVL